MVRIEPYGQRGHPNAAVPTFSCCCPPSLPAPTFLLALPAHQPCVTSSPLALGSRSG